MRNYESLEEPFYRDATSTVAAGATTVVANVLLILGSVSALVCFFLAVRDGAVATARRSEIQAAEVNKELRKLQRREDEIHAQPTDFNNPNAQKDRDEELRSLRKKRLELNEKRDSLQDKQDELEQSMLPRRPWYVLGMMVGFLLATSGGICYLFVRDRRLIGAVLVHAVLTAAFSLAVAVMFAQRF